MNRVLVVGAITAALLGLLLGDIGHVTGAVVIAVFGGIVGMFLEAWRQDRQWRAQR